MNSFIEKVDFFKGNNPEPENFYYEFIDEYCSQVWHTCLCV